MSSELATVYDPKAVEKQVYEQWIETGAFRADPGAGGTPFCIVIPPPNVTAALHLGHALNNTLQDVLVRFQRMTGRNTLWMPGTDHAGIATQTVVEKRILADEGKRRTDFKRETFVGRIQDWKDEYEARILQQLQVMGCSCDWDRVRFTMDDVCAKAVRENFWRLFRDGLIYRGKRLVNWDPATQTVLADDEVEHETVQGHFWYLQYPLVEPVEAAGEKIEHITVATTRPETMLGDTAVAMNPADPRATALIGKQVRLPLVGRLIPIIADEHVVLPDPDSDDEKARFSTGFLKVTPAHDPDDYAIGQRHDLPMVNVMAPDGSISDRHGWEDAKGSDAEQFIGMDRFEARAGIVEWFRTEKLLADVREYSHPVGHSYRSHVPIEPYLSDQWYIAVKKPIDHLAETFGEGLIDGTDVPLNSLTGLALKPVLDGRIRFVPERYARTYQTWLENLRDWPISRQLWWGHQIPVWTVVIQGAVSARHGDNRTEASDEQVGGALREYLRECGVEDESFFSARPRSLDGGDRVYYVVSSSHRADHALDLLGSYLQTPHGGGLKEMEIGRPTKDSLRNEFGQNAYDAANAARSHFVSCQRDPDVLDTWFSSALWPFSTLGWPDKTPELGMYYPGDVLSTAREIITLWVSRMVMMGQYCVGDIPFHTVFIHAMLQDGEGRKMSKSLGNGVDPLDIIDSHGADAMRFTLVCMTTQTQDVRMPVESMTLPDGRTVNSSPKFDIGRNFCNKLWNASRFAMMNLQGSPAWAEIHSCGTLADAWILSRLNATVRDVTTAIEEFRFNELAERLYHFMWDDFCDWYLEIAKARINADEATPKAIVAHTLDVLLRLLHPVAPFVTEAIWAKLNDVAPLRGPGDTPAEPALVRAQWPQADAALIAPPVDEDFALLQDLIRQIRNARSQHEVAPGRKVDVLVEASGRAGRIIADNVELLKSQAQLGEVAVGETAAEPPPNASAIAAGGVKLYVLDIIDREAELDRLTKQADTLRRGIAGIEGKLGNEHFVAKAPPAVVQGERDRLVNLQTDLAAVEKSLAALG